MALITDKFHKVSNGTRAQPTTLTAQKSLGASSITTAALNGWATDTPVDFQLYLPDANNLDNFGNPKPIPGSQSEWVGIVSGSTITQLELTGGSDTIYPIGTIVVALPTANWADSMVEGILVHANPNGSLLSSAITTGLAGTTLPANTVATTSITDLSVTTAKIADSSVTAVKTSFGGNYSATEVNTGFTWTDGKVIYKKTVTFTGSVAASGTIAHGITGLTRVINLEGALETNGAMVNVGFYSSGTNFFSAFVDATNINTFLGTARVGTGVLFLTIYYNK